MKKVQKGFRLSIATLNKLDALIGRYATQTEVVTVAIDRLYQEEVRQEMQDGLGKSYDELVKMATREYCVQPINHDNNNFASEWHVTDHAESGKVHYARKP